MARVTIDDTLLKNMANAIRTKDGSTELFGVDTFENKILNIPSGSGLPSNIKTGTFTVAEDTLEPVTITHGLGSVSPVLVYIMPDNPEYAVGKLPYAIIGGVDKAGEKVVTSNTGSITSKYGVFSVSVDNTNIVITPSTSSYKLIAGLNYRWLILEESV